MEPHATPLEKLAATRLALQQILHPTAGDATARDAAVHSAEKPATTRAHTGDAQTKTQLAWSDASKTARAARPSRLQKVAATGQSAWGHVLQLGAVMGAVAQRRWRSHPARLAADVARPLLAQQARRHPLRLLTLAATAGAAVVLLKPWRWKAPEKYMRSSAAMELRRITTAGLAFAFAQFLGRKS